VEYQLVWVYYIIIFAVGACALKFNPTNPTKKQPVNRPESGYWRGSGLLSMKGQEQEKRQAGANITFRSL
jgi:hypothetical protein